MRKYREHLVIGDSHARPDVDNSRFDILAEFVLDRQPDVIIDIGDSADMPSLSSYDVGTVRAEGHRYKDDIAAYHDAQERFIGALRRYNSTRGSMKKKKYQPRLIKTRGNHEYRIVRAANEAPRYYGHIDLRDLRENEYGWETYDFLEPVGVDGICYQHYFTSGILGRPIGGENHAASLVKKNFMSCVAGHSHTRDFWETTNAVGRRVFGLVVGCFFEHEETYTKENARYWRGLVYLHDVRDGEAEPEFLSLENYLKPKYG